MAPSSRRPTVLLCLMIALTLSGVSVSSAAPGGGAPSPTGSEPEACPDEALATTADHHLRGQGPRLEAWEETNGIDGLQTGPCVVAGSAIGPDTYQETLPPPDLGVVGLCSHFVMRQCL